MKADNHFTTPRIIIIISFKHRIMTRQRKCYSKSNSFIAAYRCYRWSKYVFSLFLNTDSDEANVTSLGRPFHTFAPATGKVRPMTVVPTTGQNVKLFSGGGPEPALDGGRKFTGSPTKGWRLN